MNQFGEKTINSQFHGVTSLGLVLTATVIAAVVMFMTSWVLGVVYLVVCVVASQAILRAFCAKCPCKTHCAHVFPGKAAMAIEREPGPYTVVELGALGLSFLLLFGLPQVWLWRYAGLFVAYWALSAIAFVQIRMVACRACDNVYCLLKSRCPNGRHA
jgi:hypothetical protein